MCGETGRPSFGGTIAVLFPREDMSSSETLLSSSPDSVTSTTSSTSMSSYTLFFRDPDADGHKTKAIFQINDTETYHALCAYEELDLRIEKHGDLSTGTPDIPPLHKLRLDMSQRQRQRPGQQLDLEFELPERLVLGVSEKGVVGRQVTVTKASGGILGVGIVGFN
ncbi:hypothetical protein N7495_002286 [Penicillium taxi]|uniref:uncharacterized protein n=1 Tax=Penicillium taxi TaxID=168475 RepID=UPI0025451C78|nr:uncharacterized protein N7495_002286 [Penicillium taxi]KAJ5901758.1 hypothetical protein N7495_002286 [Penicillium taxi]